MFQQRRPHRLVISVTGQVDGGWQATRTARGTSVHFCWKDGDRAIVTAERIGGRTIISNSHDEGQGILAELHRNGQQIRYTRVDVNDIKDGAPRDFAGTMNSSEGWKPWPLVPLMPRV